MEVFVGVKTYNRLSYFKKWIETFARTKDPNNNYLVVINDDGSCDNTRAYIKSLPTLPNVRWVLMYSDRKGTHFATNNILSIAERSEFDIAFMCDDDMFFKKKGWDELYYKASLKYNIEHLSHYCTEWTTPQKNIEKEGLKAHCSVYESQGAFWSFTKEVLDKVGYIDEKNFGRRGEGHRDWSLRACRAGHNEEDNLWDAKGSEKYIGLQKRESYIRTPGYDEEIKLAKKQTLKKRRVMKQKGRLRIEDPVSFLNRFFEKVYCINLQRRPDRKNKMKKLFEKMKLDVKFWRAVDGSKDAKVKNLVHSIKPKYPMNEGMIGCYLSHLNVYKDADKKGYERFLVLEDDLLIHKELDKVLNNLLKVKEDWSLLYLCTPDWNWRNNKNNVVEGQPYYRGKRIDGTCGYAINRKVVKEIIHLFEEPIEMPCDTRLHKIHEERECYVLYPQPFIADVRDSDLRGKRELKEYALKVNWNINNYQIKTF